MKSTFTQTQKHQIKIGKNKYQIIFRDAAVKIKAKFYWNNDQIEKGDFVLTNYKTGNKKFKLHKVRFCQEKGANRLEAFLSSHDTFSRKTYALYDESISGASFTNSEAIELLLRVSEDCPFNNINECSNTPKPDDKEGSILIGVGQI